MHFHQLFKKVVMVRNSLQFTGDKKNWSHSMCNARTRLHVHVDIL